MKRIESRITWNARPSGGLIVDAQLHFPIRIVGADQYGLPVSWSSVEVALHLLVFSWRVYFNYDRVTDDCYPPPAPSTYADWYRPKDHVPRVVGDTGCYLCEELRVCGPDHRNTRGMEHDDGCPNKL